MKFLLEQLRYHLINVDQLLDLKHVPLDDVVFVFGRGRVNLQPLGNLHVEERIRRHQSAVGREILVVWDQRLVELVTRWKIICGQVRMMELSLSGYVAGISEQLSIGSTEKYPIKNIPYKNVPTEKIINQDKITKEMIRDVFLWDIFR